MVWPAIGLGLASAGLSFFGQKSQSDRAYKQAKQQTKFQNAQAAQARNFQNLQIRKQNEYAAKAYETQKQLYQTQLQFNQDAANRAFEGVQVNRNRQLTALAFQRQNLDEQLLEAVGANEAAMEGGDNRSARLAFAKQTYGRYGDQDVQMRMQAKDITSDAVRDLRGVALDQYGANLQAYSQVAIAPYMQSELPPAMQMKMPRNTFNTGLAIGGALLGGLSTYNQFAPSGPKVTDWFSKD